MSEHDTAEPRWGDPAAAYPYCLTYEEYAQHMTEAVTAGLTQDQLDGFACTSCGAGLDQSREKIGEKVIDWPGDVRDGTHDLYVGPCCRGLVSACPAWCDRGHAPWVPGNRWLDVAMHATTLAEAEVHDSDGTPYAVSVDLRWDEDSASRAPYLIVEADRDLIAGRDGADARRIAAALLNAADRLDEIKGVSR